jgi:hypothetical protein
MEYQVPQFIEVEDKIFGPLTFKQFVYIAGGTGLCVALILYLPLMFGIILSIPVAAFSGALAFYKVNNKTFTDMLAAGFSFYTKSRLYLWRKEDKPQETVAAPMPALPPREKLVLSSGKLKDLAWSLDINEGGPTAR